MAWWNKLFGTGNKFPKIDYVIKEAFSVSGRTYYEMDDLFNLPYQRGAACLRYYSEFNMRADREYLLSHVQATDELLQFTPGKSIDLIKVKQLNNNLRDRLNWIMDEDLAYKLASVVFFDKNESPEVYDSKYNLEKIAFWKKEMAAKEFFFMQPLTRLIPFLKEFEESFETYLMVTEKLKGKYQDDISQIISKN
jgi:hypothetical protein